MNEVLSLLGLCRRAGRVSIGYAEVKQSLVSKTAKAVFVSRDISEKTLKELIFFAKDVNVIKLPCDMAELSAALGIKTKTVSVNDEGFSQKAQSLVK